MNPNSKASRGVVSRIGDTDVVKLGTQVLSDEEGRIFAGGIKGMKVGFGASFKVLADYLAQRS